MCKLLIISGLDPKRKKINWEFIKRMGVIMSENNKDGLGYTAVDKDGNIFGERWWMNWQAFDNRAPMTQPRKREHSKFAAIKDMVKGFVDLEDEADDEAFEKYNSFGTRNEDITAITLHTRMATSEKTFENVHPFYDEETETSVVHNGIIHNVSKADHIRSTCDSERILNKYLKHEVGTIPADIQNMTDELRGYFACGVFSKDNTGKRVLDVFNSRANLSAAFIKELNALVLATNLDDIRSVVRSMGFTIVFKQKQVKEHTLTRFDPMTGRIILTQVYKDNSNNYGNSTGYHYNRHSGNGYSSYEEYDPEWQALLEAEAAKTADKTEVIGKDGKLLEFTSTTSKKVASEADVANMGIESSAVSPTLPTLPEAVQKQVQEVIKRASAVDEIIDRNSADPMNEKLAIIDGYNLNDTKDMWYKKGGMKH